MNPSQMKLPNECDVCHAEIGLYKPFYTINIHPHHIRDKEDYTKPTVYCVNCFKAYKNFLIEHEVQENHKRTMREIKGEL